MNVSFCGRHFLLRWMHFNKMHTQIVELMEFNISNTCVTSWYGLMEIGGKIQFNDGLFVMYLRIMHIVKYFVQFYELIGADEMRIWYFLSDDKTENGCNSHRIYCHVILYYSRNTCEFVPAFIQTYRKSKTIKPMHSPQYMEYMK